METIRGIDAVNKAMTISKLGGSFSLSFFPYSRKKSSANPDDLVELKTYSNCSCRTPLPHDRFDVDGKHFFLFQTEDLQPRSCYRVLIRYIGFSDDNFKLKKVIWYE